jgi:hypothetical protein
METPMPHTRLILSACLLVVAVALGADGYARWPKPGPVTPTTCPHSKACPYCQGWDAFQAGQSASDNPYAPAVRNDPIHPGFRWQAGWDAAQRNSQFPIATAVADS